ncbi:MAG: hypothetical protein SF002_01825 [Alphaproteobacteria bacterium]|nr:hypothetical protein [Alphaproteobacteria bacterium]
MAITPVLIVVAIVLATSGASAQTGADRVTSLHDEVAAGANLLPQADLNRLLIGYSTHWRHRRERIGFWAFYPSPGERELMLGDRRDSIRTTVELHNDMVCGHSPRFNRVTCNAALRREDTILLCEVDSGSCEWRLVERLPGRQFP